MKSKKLFLSFLSEAKHRNQFAEPIKVLRSNAFKIGKANILIRVASDLGKRYFFGLNYINAEEIYNLDNSFIVFICGTLDRIIFIPSEILIKYLPNISHDRNGEYKINFTRDLKLVLKGRGNQIDCTTFINNWDIIKSSSYIKSKPIEPSKSIHTVVQGRLIEIGNIRGFKTYSPDKSKLFNNQRLDEISRIKSCPELQFTEHKSLRNIDVIWFRQTGRGYYPEYAFEVEFSTGVWSGFGRLATLREYSTNFYIIAHDERKFEQVINSFPELKNRYINLSPEQIGLLYSAEKNLIQMRQDFSI